MRLHQHARAGARAAWGLLVAGPGARVHALPLTRPRVRSDGDVPGRCSFASNHPQARGAGSNPTQAPEIAIGPRCRRRPIELPRTRSRRKRGPGARARMPAGVRVALANADAASVRARPRKPDVFIGRSAGCSFRRTLYNLDVRGVRPDGATRTVLAGISFGLPAGEVFPASAELFTLSTCVAQRRRWPRRSLSPSYRLCG
jgi:hypothetical protein